jgi:hypothetical protein
MRGGLHLTAQRDGVHPQARIGQRDVGTAAAHPWRLALPTPPSGWPAAEAVACRSVRVVALWVLARVSPLPGARWAIFGAPARRVCTRRATRRKRRR